MGISEAFDRAWHDGLIYKIKSVEVSIMTLNLMKNFLENRFRRVFSNNKTYSWEPVVAGVPQESILGPFIFLNLHK